MKLLHMITTMIVASSLATQIKADEAIQRNMWFQTASEKEITHTQVSVTIPTSIKNLPITEQNIQILAILREATLAAIPGLEIRKDAMLMGSPDIPKNKDGSPATDLARGGACQGITKQVNYEWFETLNWKRFLWM